METLPRPWAVDLFCGAGGLSLGLEEGGFSVVAAADSDRMSTETHAANIQSLTWTGDLSDPVGFIRQLDEWGIESVDLVAGGPPCQPFSNAGASKIGHLVKTGHRQARDERADLWRSFFSIVDRLQPTAMLFENVPNFAQAQGGGSVDRLDGGIEASRVRGPCGGAGCLEVSSSASTDPDSSWWESPGTLNSSGPSTWEAYRPFGRPSETFRWSKPIHEMRPVGTMDVQPHCLEDCLGGV